MFERFRHALARRISPHSTDVDNEVAMLRPLPDTLSGEPQSPPTGERDFYVLAINRTRGHLAFAEVRPHGLIIYSDPTQFFPTTEESREKLRRLLHLVTVERACGADEPVDLASLRVLHVKTQIVDVTTQIQGMDAESEEERQRMAALAKLTDAEARLLGLDAEKALIKLTERPPEHISDELEELVKISDNGVLDAIFGHPD